MSEQAREAARRLDDAEVVEVLREQEWSRVGLAREVVRLRKWLDQRDQELLEWARRYDEAVQPLQRRCIELVTENERLAALDRYAEAHLSAWRAARRDPADGGPLLCDLCQEPAQEWRWVDEGWSLACLPCINKVAEARIADYARTVDDPARMHLHYDGCPFKPYAAMSKYDEGYPDPRPECTCAAAHMAAYWKGQWMLERSGAEARVAEAVGGEREACAQIVQKWLAAQHKKYEKAHHNLDHTPEAVYLHSVCVLEYALGEIRQRAGAARSAPSVGAGEERGA
jgi:hypothetical protein